MPTETRTPYVPVKAAGTKSDKPPKFGDPSSGGRGTGGDDFDRLAAMLERIRKNLQLLVFLSPRVLPQELQTQFAGTWPITDKCFTDAIALLNDTNKRNNLVPLLEQAGLAGEMLRMKEVSLEYHMRRLEQATQPPKKPKSEGWVKKVVRWVKPAFKIMNTIMGSLKSVIPGIDVAKEYKEHVEAGYEVVETTLDEE